MRLSEIAALVPGCTLDAAGQDPDITGFKPIDEAVPGDLAYVSSPKYVSLLKHTKASAVVVEPHVVCHLPCLRTKNPRLMFAKFVKHIHSPRPPAPGIHASAVVADDARIGTNVSIGAGVVIGNGVVVEDGVVLYPNCVLYADVTVGSGTVIHANSVLCEKTKIGANCIVYPGAVIGGDGFGHELQEDGTWFKIPQAGEVVIEDEVEIGCLTAIDKPALGKTIVHKGAKVDNLVQIGHGCKIGPYSIIVSQVGMAGGVKLGHHVVLAGQVGIADHISIGDGARIGAKSGIPSDVEPGVVLMGYPVLPEREWKRLVVAERRLPELLRTVARLESRIAELEARLPKDQP